MSTPAPVADRTTHPWLGDATGGLADLGVFVPLAAALILVNGLDAGALFVCAGLLVIGAGVAFRIPFPVQPLKALTAVAIARELSPDVIHAAGLELAAFLLVLSIGHVADLVARVFVKPVVRALQLGVGGLLVITAIKLVADPPEVFSAPPSPWSVFLALTAFIGVAIAAHRRSYAVALVMFAGGLLATIAGAQPNLAAPTFTLPSVHLPPASAFGTAFLLLVVPQLPLTFGNAVVAVNDLAHEYFFGPAGDRVTPSRVCLSAGIGNSISAVLGGMPMCHGAGGLTAHVRLGARTARMNLWLGGAFLTLGLFFAAQIPVILGVLPVSVLAAFLAYAGLRHAWLVSDLRGLPLAIAVVSGALGAWYGNLAITAALALMLEHGRRVVSRRVRNAS